jgi:hypothetical protein
MMRIPWIQNFLDISWATEWLSAFEETLPHCSSYGVYINLFYYVFLLVFYRKVKCSNY